MKNEIKLLDSSLLKDVNKLQELLYWLRVMERPNGWHYDLDHIWILNELEKAGIQPGATIVDAGAGQGVMQYLLAARGYNVISLDFSPRVIPDRSKGIFEIIGEGNTEISYQHPYMKFIKYGGGFIGRLKLSKFIKVLEMPRRIFRKVMEYTTYINERFFRQHKNYGSIRYVRAPFHDIPLDAEIADAVISVSAIEHSDINLFDDNIRSLVGLLKHSAMLLLTTSATHEKNSIYDHKVEGWCYSQAALEAYFPDVHIDFDAEKCERSLLNSKVFMQRLDSYYYTDSESPFYKKQFTSLPYLPVAIKIKK